jgi:hypothetical protein
LLLVVLLLAAGFVSFWRLGTASWNTDELIYRNAGRGALSAVNREHPMLVKELIDVSVERLGEGPGAVRLPSALLGLVTGAALLALGWRLAGFGAGVAAAALWSLLPQAPGVLALRITRYGMLEPAMICFGMLALLAASLAMTGPPAAPAAAWTRSRGRGRLRMPVTGPWAAPVAACAGLALGLSASSKFTGAVLGPAVLLAVALAPGPLPRRLGRVVLLGLGAVAGFLGPYVLAGGDWIGALGFAVRFQSHHAEVGHVMMVAGHLTHHPPWWATFWWQQTYLGVPGTVALWLATVAGLVAVWRADRRAAAVLTTALLLPLAVLSLSPLQLPHYHLAMSAVQALTAGLGLAAIWPGARHPLRPHPGRVAAARPRAAGIVLAVALAAGLVPASTGLLTDVATLQPDDYRAAGEWLAANGPSRPKVMVHGYRRVAAAYLPGAEVVSKPARGMDAVMVDPFVAERSPHGPAPGSSGPSRRAGRRIISGGSPCGHDLGKRPGPLLSSVHDDPSSAPGRNSDPRQRAGPGLRGPVCPAHRPPRARMPRLLRGRPARHHPGGDPLAGALGHHPVRRPLLGVRAGRPDSRPRGARPRCPGARPLLRPAAHGVAARRLGRADRRPRVRPDRPHRNG